FPGADIAEETQRQGYGTEDDGDHFDDAHEEEDGHQGVLENSGEPALGAEDVDQRTPDAQFADRDPAPHHHEDRGQGQGHVEVGGGGTQQRGVDVREADRARLFPQSDGAHPGNKAEPVGGEDEDENGGQQGEGLRRDVLADDALDLAVEEFYEELDEVL